MIGAMHHKLRRFTQETDGSMALPFALWVPFIIMMMLSSVELGTLTMRHVNLERAVDQTVRQIRLSPGASYSHTDIKQQICDRAAILPNCMVQLELEMVRLDLRNWTPPPSVVRCVDMAEPDAESEAGFQNGVGNELMFVRACYKYDPVSPTSYLGGAMTTRGDGYIGLVSTSAFVIEPS